MTSQFGGILDAITRVGGVRGALLVARDDGVVVAETLMEGIKGGAVAALAASLYKRLGNTTHSSGIGQPGFLQLQASGGALLALGAGEDLLVVAVAESQSNVGLVRLEMLRAAGAVT